MPEDGGAFVDAVHEQADVLEVVRRLLNSGDEKIMKSVLDRLVNLKYGNAEQSFDPDRDVLDMTGAPRPVRNPPPPPQGT